ncbi:3'-5' exonuclease [Pelagicoccus sp. SDUM812003]|uniref:3'-5' exonuclease n=1 Tax=Pelagicoccus sp. SDUM812003 TaxID=3041267 RepID=UPI00280EB340|nr:3'-5' exonuclease [Pelagicoccus sp. SDUM812003]MDQ8201624.1 3'-5' exonuclease [Pelagicoccus sp. SDUM812003]
MDPFWDELPIHVIDFEGGPHCGIVEFGVVTLKGTRIVDAATRLCRPKASISRKEQATHGIGNEDAKRCLPFAQEWDRFANLRETGPLAAHFASAENSMIKAVFPYARLSDSWMSDDRKVAEWGPWIDTGYVYRNYGDDGSSLKLEDLVMRWELQRELDELAAKYCPENRSRYHCALYDALASALLLLLYCNELSDGKPTVRQLLAESQGSSARREKFEQQQLF